jgi:hypothetical protein
MAEDSDPAREPLPALSVGRILAFMQFMRYFIKRAMVQDAIIHDKFISPAY